MACTRCGFSNAVTATVCQQCGLTLRPAGGTSGTLGGLAKSTEKIDTSWLPKGQAKPGLTKAAAGLAAHKPSSIWQAQTPDTPSHRQTRPLPFSQGAAAAIIPGVVLCAVYAAFQAVWRRGIFSTIAHDPIGVSDYAAHRSDTVNLVLLGFTVAFVVLAVAGGAFWVAKNRLVRAFRGAGGWIGGGASLCLVAALLCQGDSAARISYAYVVGAVGTLAVGGGLAYVMARAIQSVVGDLSWLPRPKAATPRRGKDARAGLAGLAPQQPTGDLAATGLVPAKKQTSASTDWASLKSK